MKIPDYLKNPNNLLGAAMLTISIYLGAQGIAKDDSRYIAPAAISFVLGMLPLLPEDRRKPSDMER